MGIHVDAVGFEGFLEKQHSKPGVIKKGDGLDRPIRHHDDSCPVPTGVVSLCTPLETPHVGYQ